MAKVKLKVPGNKPRKSSTHEKPEPASVSRKKRKVSSDDDDDDVELESEEGAIDTMPEQSRRKSSMSQSQSQPPDPENLFEDDIEVDVVTAPAVQPDSDIPDRAPTPTAAPSRRRGKKKAATVYSDEDDDFIDSGRKQDDGDDDDFLVDSPPKKSGRKGGTGAPKGRGKGAKAKTGGIAEIEIKMKDERKVVQTKAPGDVSKKGTKRRRETVSERTGVAAADVEVSTPVVQPSASTASVTTNQPQRSTATTSQPSKIRKLPPIKKNKTLAGATSTAPSSGPSTPSASTAAAAAKAVQGGNANPNAPPGALPLHASLPRKPLQKTTDVDLSSPDIYNSLFKTGSSAPRVGVNSRLKEEERRKELMKMRDEARAVRMANLQKNSFDLLAAEEKVASFEARLRARNSTALYPNHLASALKLIMPRGSGAPVGGLVRVSGPRLGPEGG